MQLPSDTEPGLGVREWEGDLPQPGPELVQFWISRASGGDAVSHLHRRDAPFPQNILPRRVCVAGAAKGPGCSGASHPPVPNPEHPVSPRPCAPAPLRRTPTYPSLPAPGAGSKLPQPHSGAPQNIPPPPPPGTASEYPRSPPG